MRLGADIPSRLAALADRPVNYDAEALDLQNPGPGWHIDHRLQPLPAEAPGAPEEEGSFEIAARLLRGYEFADPSLVRAHYDPETPLAGRNMLLQLRAFNLIRIYVGVRVHAVYEEDRVDDSGRAFHVFGWDYRTLEGHVECGQMDWEVWKWPDSGEVAFHVHAVSRAAPLRNPVIRTGFWLVSGHERELFLDSTDRRMRTFTELGLQQRDGESRGERIRQASHELTARRQNEPDAHAGLADRVDRPRP